MNTFLKSRVIRELLYVLVLFALIMPFVVVERAQAATSATVTITAQPAFVGIANSPSTWTVNNFTHSGFVKNNTVYYSNPTGDNLQPTGGGVLATECAFNMTNTSTVATNITLNIANFTGGDADANTNLGTNNATAFGAYGYYTGLAYANKVIAKTTASGVLIPNLAALTYKGWGIEIKLQANDWTSASNMTTTAVITAIAAE